MSALRPIVLAAGGTGGHLFPAKALAEVLIRRGRRVAFATDRRGAAAGDFGAAEVHVVRAAPMSGGGIAGRVRGAVDLALGTLEARRLLKGLGAAAVVGFGGYPSVPPVAAAVQLGLPAMVHEQNAVLGRANRLLAGRVGVIAVSFPATAAIKPHLGDRVRLTGNPVRGAVAALAATTYATPNEVSGLRVLVMGGSLGAHIMSTVVPPALAALPIGLRSALHIAQQCRAEDLEAVRRIYRDAGITADLATFFGDVPARLAAAHLVVARAGASTVAELTAAGRPGILVPYRFAADDHQTANARALEAHEAAWVMPENAFTPEALSARIETLANAPDVLAASAARARALGRPGAAEALADAVEKLVPVNDNGGTRGHPREEAA